MIIARRLQPLRPPFSREQNVRSLVPTLSVPAIFIISAVVALTLPGTAMQLWWLIARTLSIGPVVGQGCSRRAAPQPRRRITSLTRRRCTAEPALVRSAWRGIDAGGRRERTSGKGRVGRRPRPGQFGGRRRPDSSGSPCRVLAPLRPPRGAGDRVR